MLLSMSNFTLQSIAIGIVTQYYSYHNENGLLLNVLWFSSKVTPCTYFRLGDSKAAAHVAVDLQCWYTVKQL